jgi:hypothetical protein
MALLRVNGTDTWICSAQMFDFLLREFQQALTSHELVSVLEAVLQSQLHWWSIADVNAAHFQAFLAAVQKAETVINSQGPKSPNDLDRYSAVLARLSELIRLLAADPRAKENRVVPN